MGKEWSFQTGRMTSGCSHHHQCKTLVGWRGACYKREKYEKKCTGTEMLREKAAYYMSCICIRGSSKAKTGFQGHLYHPSLPTYQLGETVRMMELFRRFEGL